MVDLVYVERATADTDVRLRHLLEARAKAAERCVEANQKAAEIKALLIDHLARMAQAGAARDVLRKALQDSGINPGIVTALLDAAYG